MCRVTDLNNSIRLEIYFKQQEFVGRWSFANLGPTECFKTLQWFAASSVEPLGALRTLRKVRVEPLALLVSVKCKHQLYLLSSLSHCHYCYCYRVCFCFCFLLLFRESKNFWPTFVLLPTLLPPSLSLSLLPWSSSIVNVFCISCEFFPRDLIASLLVGCLYMIHYCYCTPGLPCILRKVTNTATNKNPQKFRDKHFYIKYI